MHYICSAELIDFWIGFLWKGARILRLPRIVSVSLFATTLFAGQALAETLTGTVTNRTSNKPSAGDDVTAMDVGQGGMTEAARTKTDARGKFKFNIASTGPHLIRVLHQGVTYNKMAPPGTPAADIEVYDVAEKIAELSVTADVLRMQTSGGQLQVIEIIAVHNPSQPPRTQMNDHAFEFYLPENAKVDSVGAQTAGGIPVNAGANPLGGGLYTVAFPLRPGDTRFQISYHLPYSGSAKFSPRTKLPQEHFVVMMAPEMKFVADNPARFTPPPPNSGFNATVQIAQNITPGSSDLGFKVSGNGTLPDEQAQPAQGRAPNGGGAAPAADGGSDSQAGGGGVGMGGGGGQQGPGGGLGAPIDAPDPLAKYRWYILAGFVAVLAMGAAFILSRKKDSAIVMPEGIAIPAASAAPPYVAEPASYPAAGSSLLQVLKDELFQLEIEKQQGKLSDAEYAKAKSALDETLSRAIKRQG